MMNNLRSLEYWKLVWHVIRLINNHVGVSEDDNEAIGGQEYEDVPDSLEVGGGHGDDADASFPKVFRSVFRAITAARNRFHPTLSLFYVKVTSFRLSPGLSKHSMSHVT